MRNHEGLNQWVTKLLLYSVLPCLSGFEHVHYNHCFYAMHRYGSTTPAQGSAEITPMRHGL